MQQLGRQQFARDFLTGLQLGALRLTYRPIRGCSDAERNCISNVRPEGLSYDAAAFKLVPLLEAARGRKLTGGGLKDESVWNQVALSGGDDERA